MATIGHLTQSTYRRWTAIHPKDRQVALNVWQSHVEDRLWQLAIGYYALLWLVFRKAVWALAMTFFAAVVVSSPFLVAAAVVSLVTSLLAS